MDFATIGVLINLFKEAVGFVDRRDTQRRRLLEQTFQPLYDHLTVIIIDYRNALDDIEIALNAETPDLHKLFTDTHMKRRNLIVTRNEIIARSIMHIQQIERDEDSAHSRLSSEDCIVLQFTNSIIELFFADGAQLAGSWPLRVTIPLGSDDNTRQSLIDPYSASHGSPLITQLSNISGAIRRQHKGESNDVYLTRIRHSVHESVITLDHQWIIIAKIFAELKQSYLSAP